MKIIVAGQDIEAALLVFWERGGISADMANDLKWCLRRDIAHRIDDLVHSRTFDPDKLWKRLLKKR